MSRNVHFFLGIKCWSLIQANNKYILLKKLLYFVEKNAITLIVNIFYLFCETIHKEKVPIVFLPAVAESGTFENMCTNQFFQWAKCCA